ncbi:MAG: hypothetical protein PHO32_07665 [Candidatus Cloacimonetes bacterium]|nr:hypothetical protein [Candidatus Cloacimonadota bacterium]
MCSNKKLKLTYLYLFNIGMLLAILVLHFISVNRIVNVSNEQSKQLAASKLNIEKILELSINQDLTKNKGVRQPGPRTGEIANSIAKCREDIDNHKMNMEEELDNELNKISFWITIAVILMGMSNVALYIGPVLSMRMRLESTLRKSEPRWVNRYKMSLAWTRQK